MEKIKGQGQRDHRGIAAVYAHQATERPLRVFGVLQLGDRTRMIFKKTIKPILGSNGGSIRVSGNFFPGDFLHINN
jgi:hypothetical protein